MQGGGEKVVKVNLHPSVYEWIDEMAKITKPDKIVWIDGSEKEKQRLIKEALESGELMELNQEKLPGCYLHRTHPSDVARVEDRTFICTPTKEEAGPTNNWMTQTKLTRCSTHFLTGP